MGLVRGEEATIGLITLRNWTLIIEGGSMWRAICEIPNSQDAELIVDREVTVRFRIDDKHSYKGETTFHKEGTGHFPIRVTGLGSSALIYE